MAEDVTALALRAQSGDPTAIASFIRATQRDVWQLCAHLGSRDAADDLTQETYLRAFRSLPRYAARASARTWLLSIARRVCADAVREQRRRPRLTPTAPASTEPTTPDPAGHHAVHDLVAALEPGRRAAFVLTQLLGYPYADAAEICGCPVGTIRSRVARAREDLVAAVRSAEGRDQATGR